MPNTKFFTGKGDDGVSKIGGENFSKRNPAVQFLGALDELNSFLGFGKICARGVVLGRVDIGNALHKTQEDLFIIQAEIAKRAFKYEKGPTLGEEKVKALEALIALIDEALPPLKKFVISGSNELSARLDVARATARRVERIAKEYAELEGIDLSPVILQYLNRLSSALFALGRYANHIAGIEEEYPKYL